MPYAEESSAGHSTAQHMQGSAAPRHNTAQHSTWRACEHLQPALYSSCPAGGIQQVEPQQFVTQGDLSSCAAQEAPEVVGQSVSDLVRHLVFLEAQQYS